MKQLEVVDLNVSFQHDSYKNRVLNDLSFSIDKNQIVGIMGRSGCGKTVCAMTIMGLLERIGGDVDSGQILFEGSKDLLLIDDDEFAVLRGLELAMIPQNPVGVLNPVVPVGKQIAQTIAFYQKISLRGLDIDEEVEKVLRLSGLADEPGIRKKYPKQLSVGMCQRVAIGLGICGNPSLLIADEPTASLDYNNKDWVLDKLLELRDTLSMSILLITHDKQKCRHMSDKLLYLENGSVYEIYE